jgi:hypothetical protein
MREQKRTLEDCVKKLLGKPPYDHPSNICWNDSYYHKSLEREYGEANVAREIARQRQVHR